MSDLEIVQNRISKLGKRIEMSKDKKELLEISALKKSKEALEKGIALRSIEFTEDELLVLKNFSFITLKPIIYVANVSEDDAIVGTNEYVEKVREYASNEGSGVVVLSAKLESELSELEVDDKNSGLDKLIFETYNLLGLATFFTAGEKECRAWTFKKGMKAPACAGIIHSDFERGFIRCETMSFEDLEKYGSELKVKEAGRMRLEGKEYLMQDGDICYFRFNV